MKKQWGHSLVGSQIRTTRASTGTPSLTTTYLAKKTKNKMDKMDKMTTKKNGKRKIDDEELFVHRPNLIFGLLYILDCAPMPFAHLNSQSSRSAGHHANQQSKLSRKLLMNKL
jgi:hypothetical protein